MTGKCPLTIGQRGYKNLVDGSSLHSKRDNSSSSGNRRFQGEVDMVGRPVSSLCWVKVLCLGYHDLSVVIDQQYDICRQVLDSRLRHLPPVLDNLNACLQYTRGVAILAYLYDNLSYVSQYAKKKCGGYIGYSWQVNYVGIIVIFIIIFFITIVIFFNILSHRCLPICPVLAIQSN